MSALDQMVSFFHEREPDALDRSLYHLAGASREDLFVFTSSAAEAVAQVIWSVYSEVTRKEGKTHFITSFL